MSNEMTRLEQLDREKAAETARLIFGKLAEINPDDVICSMNIVVCRAPETDTGAEVSVFVLGSDEDMAKMLKSLVSVIKNSLEEVNTAAPPKHQQN